MYEHIVQHLRAFDTAKDVFRKMDFANIRLLMIR